MKYSLLALCLLSRFAIYSQGQSVGLTDNTTDGSFDFSSNPITGSPTLNGSIGVNYDVMAARLFLASPTSGTDRPTFRGIDAVDLPVADNTSQAGIVSTTTQIFGGAKTFSSSIAISGTSGNTFALETSGFVYDASNNRIGINTSVPSYMFDLKAQSATTSYYVHRASDNDVALLMDFDTDNIRWGLIDADGNTTVKLRSNSVSFIKNHFIVGDNANDDNNPQFKVVGVQDYTNGNASWVNYQSTVQNHTDTDGESASIGFGVDATKSVIGAYISFVRTASPSMGGLHFGVHNSDSSSIEDVITLEAGQLILNQQTASTIAVLNANKQLVSGTVGSGISLSSDALALDINGLTEETSVDRNADYIAIYDASTGTIDKAKPTKLALGLTLQGMSNAIDPSDDANYFIGAIPAIAGTIADINRIYMPKSGTVKAVYVTFYNGVTGSSESSTLYLKVNTTALVNLGTVQNNVSTTTLSNIALSTHVTQGDYIELKWDCPTWATNPEDVYLSYVVYIE